MDIITASTAEEMDTLQLIGVLHGHVQRSGSAAWDGSLAAAQKIFRWHRYVNHPTA